MLVVTGYFENSPECICVQVGEFTLCGDAFDIGNGFGEFVEDETPRSVTCDKCQDLIKIARKARLSRVTRERESEW